jgi:hypothetical protein
LIILIILGEAYKLWSCPLCSFSDLSALRVANILQRILSVERALSYGDRSSHRALEIEPSNFLMTIFNYLRHPGMVRQPQIYLDTVQNMCNVSLSIYCIM